MKKILFTAVLTLIGIHTVTAQVGIGTENPKTSLQVVGKPASTTTADGVQVPSLSLAELNAKIAAYGTDQNGAIVYIDNVSTATSTAETASINAVGFYYYDAVGDTWKVLSNTSSLADGSITSAKILDGTILNADISASAAIAQSKIDGLSTSLAAKANLASPTFTGTVSGIDKTMVGLGNVDNTTDLNKPISTLTQSALDLKAPLASPTFTGTVSGIDKTMIGLGSVDNTTDLNKPISTLTQSALDLKADLASPTFTGTPTLPTGTIGVTQKAGSSSTAVATTEFVATAVAGVDAAGLVSITENGNTGYRRADADADNYGDIGVGAVDLSFSEFTGPIFGATGFQSTAMGLNNVASGQSSFVIGTGNSALGNNSISVGNNTMASGYLSTAMGEGSLASGNFSTVMGIKTVASDFGSVVIGQYNNSGSTATSNTSFSDNAPAFVIGNGSSIAKSDAFKVLFNGNTTAAGTVTAPAFVGDGSQLTGITTASIADGSITSAKILDGTILNADISASAAIAQSKIDGLSTSLAAKANLASPTFTGTVSGIDKTMVGLGSVDNTTDLNKPISTLTQSALDLKAPLASPTFTGTVSGIDKTMIGLGSVDNTTDLNKPISTLTQSALDLKAPLASPTFTGTVSGIDKTMIGLGSVDNTTDLNKPISTLTQSALDLKAPLDSPTFTGTPTLPTGTIGVTQKAGSSSTAVATTEFVATALAGVDAAGLVSVTENGNIGYRRADGDSDLYYGNIGDGAVDLSFSENTNNILGATGQYAFATGYNTYASGNNSTAMGYGANALGFLSTAIGFSAKASGNNSTAMGSNTIASGGSSFAIGNRTIASGIYSTAMGYETTASGRASLATGYNTTASDYGSMVIGHFNNAGSAVSSGGSATSFDTDNTAFVIGNGTSTSAKSDAFVVDFSGNVTASGEVTAPAFVGDGSQLTGITTTSIADASITSAKILDGEIVNADISTTAEIDQSKIDGLSNSLADKANLDSPTFTGTPTLPTGTIGVTQKAGSSSTAVATTEFVATALAGVDAAGLVSVTEGSNTGYRRADADAANYGDIGVGAVDLSFSKSTGTANGASGLNSIAMGVRTTASGYASSAMGNQTTASGYFSTAMGDRTTASDFGSVVIGQYNSSGSTATSNTSFSASAPAFVIGNGTGSSDLNDAFVVDFSGNTIIGGDIFAGRDILATGVVAATEFVGDGSQLTDITTTSIADASITSAKILDGTLVNADISSDAAIAQSKIEGLGTSLTAKADLDSPTFTGTPTLPTGTIGVTQTAEDNTTAVATTEFVATAVAGVDAAGLVSVTENGNTGYRRADADADNYGDIGVGAVDLSFSEFTGPIFGATGFQSTAMGLNNVASGQSSFVIGTGNSALGNNSISVGNNTMASGYLSTAMGEGSLASGNFSTVMGIKTVASDFGSVVIGQYNNSGSTATSNTSFSDNAPAFVIGNGSSIAKSDAFKVLFNGNTNAAGTVTAPAFVGDGSQLTGISTASIADASITSAKILDGTLVNADISTSAAIAQSKIEGLGTSLTAKADLDSPTFTGTPTLPTGTIGVTQKAGSSSTAVATTEFVATAVAGVDAAGLVSITEGVNTGYRRADADAANYGDIGSGAVDLSFWDYADFGSREQGATGEFSLATGDYTTASGYTSTAMGSYTYASGYISTAMGQNSIASGDKSTAMGYNTYATGDKSTAIGNNTNASGDISTAMGSSTTASGEASTAMGSSTTASDYGSLVIGHFNNAGSAVSSGGSATVFDTDNTAFVIGNGTSSTAKSDAFKVLFNGNTTSAGTVTAPAFVGDGSQLTGITTASIADASITSAKILDGTLVNADISTSAAIAQSKIDGLSTSLAAKANLASPRFTGAVTLDNIFANGDINANGFIFAPAFVGDGSQLTNITTASIADGSITSAKILDGTILNADISASAAIAQSKIDGLSTSLAAKANLASPTFTGTITSDDIFAYGDINANGFIFAPAFVGDGSQLTDITTASIADASITSAKILDGTILNADISASAAIAQSKIDGLSTSLAAKANLASPIFTGTVSGIDKTMIGLGSVDNTTDLNKPISTLTQSALDLKAPLASPTFTGTPTLPTGTIGVTQTAGSSSTAVATTEFVATALAGVTDPNFDLSGAVDGDLLRYDAAAGKWLKVTPDYISNGDTNVGFGTTTPESSAALEVKSTSQGFLPPRMTTNERNLIDTPVPGLMIYNTTTNQLNLFNATQWTTMDGTSASSAPNAPAITGVTSGNGQVDVAFTAPADNGGSTITGYTATSSPDGITGSISQAGSGTITVSGLTNLTAYTFTVTATNALGTSAASEASASVTPALQVGDNHEGGIIAYILVSGDTGYDPAVQHGIIAAPSDQGTGAEWGCSGTSISTSTAIGTGNQNTINIMSGCSTAGIAARLCGDLVLNGYSDWYLPSSDELGKLWNNRTAIGNLNQTYYWSSTQDNSNYAIRIRISSGDFSRLGKSSTSVFLGVRAIRSF